MTTTKKQATKTNATNVTSKNNVQTACTHIESARTLAQNTRTLGASWRLFVTSNPHVSNVIKADKDRYFENICAANVAARYNDGQAKRGYSQTYFAQAFRKYGISYLQRDEKAQNKAIRAALVQFFAADADALKNKAEAQAQDDFLQSDIYRQAQARREKMKARKARKAAAQAQANAQ